VTLRPEGLTSRDASWIVCVLARASSDL
jgi:hypothetical protein